MDQTPDSFAYRCLPLNIANAHGWEVLTPFGFEAVWDGGVGTEAVTVTPDPGAQPERMAVSMFGQGVLTFHVEGLIRTPPGWSLMVGGSPNRFKDAIAPLGGVIETDWSPFTFTMNWRFTRPHTPVRFEAMEPFCFMMPVQTAATEAFEPRFEPMSADPDLERRFSGWNRSRDDFQRRMREAPPAASADKWQKHYYRGVDSDGEAIAPEHRTKVRLKPFDRTAAPHVFEPPTADAAGPPPAATTGSLEQLRRDLAKRQWLLETLERQRDLAPATIKVERRSGLGADEFLERYYAVNRPVILTGEMADWPALTLWTPDYLKAKAGVPADGSPATIEAPAPLAEDQRPLDRFLDPDGERSNGVMSIGPAGTFAPLQHELANSLIAQAAGRTRFLLLPAAEVGRLYNSNGVFSDIPDLEQAVDVGRYPRLAEVRAYQVELQPGEILFLPLGWWRQARALDFSVTLAYANFRWANNGFEGYPGGPANP